MAKAEYRSSLRSKKLIINALVDLLDEKPLDKITVTDIVKKADINRGTFYAHYENVSHADFVFYNSFYSGGIIKLYRDWFIGELPITFDELTERASVLLLDLRNRVSS